MAACTQVFSTYELLENILLHLPLLDLLLAEGVSKQVQGIIKRSNRIGQVLFREPGTSGTTISYRKQGINGFGLNGINYPGWFTGGGEYQEPIINPFIRRFVGSDCDPGILHHGFIDMRHGLSSRERLSRALTAFFHKDASWKTMLMLQPPARELMFDCLETIGRENIFGVENADGVTLNQMRKCLGDHWQECPNCPIFEPDDGRNMWVYDGQIFVDKLHKETTGWEVFEEIRDRVSPV